MSRDRDSKTQGYLSSIKMTEMSARITLIVEQFK